MRKTWKNCTSVVTPKKSLCVLSASFRAEVIFREAALGSMILYGYIATESLLINGSKNATFSAIKCNQIHEIKDEIWFPY